MVRRKTSQLPPRSIDYSQLSNFPNVAKHIGVLIGSFAVLERQIPNLLHHLTRHANHDAEAIAGSFLSNAHKIELIETLLRLRNLSDAEGEFEIARRFCTKLREANATRNRYAHSLYARSGRQALMVTFASDAKRKTEKRYIKVTDIKRDIRRIEKLIWYLSGYLKRNEKPPKRYWSSK